MDYYRIFLVRHDVRVANDDECVIILQMDGLARPGASKGVSKRSHFQYSGASWIGEPGGQGTGEPGGQGTRGPKISAKNKKNRSFNKVPPAVGSLSVARRVYKKKKKRKEVTAIGMYEIVHYSKKTHKMVNEEAEKNELRIKEANSTLTPAEICLKQLKHIPGHIKGRSASTRNILGNEKLRLDLESEKERSQVLEENMKVLKLREEPEDILKRSEASVAGRRLRSSVEALGNNVEVLKIPENKLELMNIPEIKLESLKLPENRPNVDEDDDIIDDEDVLPHDLAYSDDEDLVNADDDGVAVVYSSEEEDWSLVITSDVAWGHGDDGGGDDRPPPHKSAGGCRGKGTRKPNLGSRKAGRMHTRKETRNLGLRKVTNELGPQPIRFEWKDNGTMLPLGDHSSHWANLLGEIVREFSMHFGSWSSIPAKRKAGVLGKIRTQFDLQPHMQSEIWLDIRKGIDQHLGKIYTDNKSSLKKDYWVKNPDDETYDLEAIRSRRPANISAKD
ncbi:hypothetical protein Tco_0448617 [Tanacetum coccineum]